MRGLTLLLGIFILLAPVFPMGLASFTYITPPEKLGSGVTGIKAPPGVSVIGTTWTLAGDPSYVRGMRVTVRFKVPYQGKFCVAVHDADWKILHAWSFDQLSVPGGTTLIKNIKFKPPLPASRMASMTAIFLSRWEI